jgi:threonine dehydrogenase-like Zn-dependent dehydrogenase
MSGTLPPRVRALEIALPGRRLRGSERPLPPPRAGDVLVAVRGCALSELDLAEIATAPPGHVPGHALCGAVVAAEDSSARFAPGTLVVAPARLACGACAPCTQGRGEACTSPDRPRPGGLASHAWIPGRCLVPLTDGLEAVAAEGWRLAVTGGALLLAYHGLGRVSLSPGDQAIVIGLDGVGLAAIAVAAALGAIPFGVDDRRRRLELAQEHGAAGVVCSADRSPSELAADLDRLAAAHTRSSARRAVVARPGAAGLLARAVHAVAPGGSLLLLGRPPAESSLPAAVLASRAALLVTVEEGHPDLLCECLAHCARGRISVDRLTHGFDMEAADDAVMALRRGDEERLPVLRLP